MTHDLCQCLAKTEEEWEARADLVVVQANTEEWWVFKPHQGTGRVSAPTTYTRLRRVKLVNKRYIWCSYGLPSRCPRQVRNLQFSQQNAATVIDQENDTWWERWSAVLWSSSKLASGCSDVLDVIDTIMEEMHLKVTATVASRPVATKRVSEIAFPVTGRARQRVEKRKKNRGQY
ncbi:hypothetical protein IV203_032868 [Nitzschia inconspicua]|uniref:Uncharacterized protein n=1 Tax=Nitzschia inconspicua TaxID=303405 RepID=A0A9K3KKH0_9STRA|nr:hypothetical protein IV203_032868 [Nitzschia inconspicua]